MLLLEECGFRYPATDRWIFHRQNLQVARGDVVRIVGRNGSGKSTLLKIAAGLLEPLEGTVRTDSDERVIYMDQFAGDMLNLGFTIDEQMGAFGDGQVSGHDDLAKFDLGLEDRSNEFIGHLSGGQRQIVALLATVRAGGRILCLDEFSSALDDHSSKVAGSYLADSVERNEVGLLIVSHLGADLRVTKEVVLD